MTDIGFRANPESVRYKENASDPRLGVRIAEIGAADNSNVVIAGNAGFCPVGSTEGELNTDGQCDEYVASGGVPEVTLGVRKISNTLPMEHTFTYPEEYVIALAKGATLTVNYPGSPVNTTIDTGNGSITVNSIPVATGAGANYSAGQLIEIVCGTSTYGTRSLFRRIKSISGDVITLKKVLPAYFLPANGAAVKKVASLDYTNNTAEFSDPFMYRVLEMDNVNQTVHIEYFKVQATKGKYVAGAGKEPPKATLKLHTLGVYNASTGYYDVSTRREIA